MPPPAELCAVLRTEDHPWFATKTGEMRGIDAPFRELTSRLLAAPRRERPLLAPAVRF